MTSSDRLPRLRARPEDFVVEEVPLYEPSGEGDHTFVEIEKRLRTTEQVVSALAQAAGVAARDVGYAGRKDRIAVTRQWLSVPGLDPERALDLDLPGARVLRADRHGNKLRTGHLRANRFEITLRDVDPAVADRAEARLAELVQRGFPNRFGDQRFGRDGTNAELGAAVLRGDRRMRDRRKGRFFVSALQSAVFNEVLRRRPVPLDEMELGDVAVVTASGGLFDVEDLERENERAGRFEISATGPLFGTRARQPAGAVAEREVRVAADLGVPAVGDLRPPRGIRLRGGRRSLRARPEDASLERAPEGLRLRFTLPSGCYATVLVEEWVGPVIAGPSDSDIPRPRDDTSARPEVC